ncbi:MAG: hypothetical protein ABI876_00385 [Bacteroidota bacterium]
MNEKKLLLHGWTFKAIRALSGYSAREFGMFLAEEGMRPTTARGVYGLEEQFTIKPKYVLALRRFLGAEVYDQLLEFLLQRNRERHAYP